MKQIFLGIILLAGVLCGVTLVAAPVVLASQADLRSKHFWKTHKNVFIPQGNSTQATIDLPENKWSSLFHKFKLHRKNMERVKVILKCRLVGDLKKFKFTSLVMRFLDSSQKDMKIKQSAIVVIKAGWQTIAFDAVIPDKTQIISIGLNSHGGEQIEISKFDVSLINEFDLSTAAIKGIKLKNHIVPGVKYDYKVHKEFATVPYFKKVAFEFDNLLWKMLPKYKILATEKNKSPRTENDSTAWFKIACDKNYLVVKFHADDDRLCFQYDRHYQNDCFEFFLMPTGTVTAEKSSLRQENFKISRTKTGKTTIMGDIEGKTRLVDNGWEALMRIRLQDDKRGIHPFNGLTLSFNASYQDADTISQEHWMSFSPKDKASKSWCNPALYIPLIFRCQNDMPYRPLRYGDDVSYDVTPTYAGLINLIESEPALTNFSFWRPVREATVTIRQQKGEKYYHLSFPKDDGVKYNSFQMMFSPFNVLAGEILDIEFDAKADKAIEIPKVFFLTQMNWSSVKSKQHGKLTANWHKYNLKLKVSEKFQGILRNGRIWLDFGKPRECSISLKNLKVTRRLPNQIDALIRVSQQYSHYWADEANILFFKINYALKSPKQVTITANIRSFFSKKQELKMQWQKELKPGRQVIKWAIDKLPMGFFNVTLQIKDSDNILVHRELYISKSRKIAADQSNPYSGLWFHSASSVAPPLNWNLMTDLLRGIGIGMVYFNHVYFNDAYGEFAPDNSLTAFKKFKDAGFLVGAAILQQDPHSGQIWQTLDELKDHARPIISALKGIVDVWNFANEPNLPGGWSPFPDGREWSMFYRMFYNLVHECDPDAKVILGSMNRVPIDYFKQEYLENKNYFFDDIIGVHLYGFDPDRQSFERLLEKRKLLDEIYPEVPVWDNESGAVHKDYASITHLQSKRMPVILNAGYINSFFYNDRDILFPCSDSNPLLPMEAFKNAFLYHVKPMGRVTMVSDAVHVYIFKDDNDLGKIAFWNTGNEQKKLTLPIRENALLYDLFGNILQNVSGKELTVKLNNKFVHYMKGVDIDKLMSHSTFIAAFRPVHKKNVTAGFVTDVYIAPRTVSLQFDRELAINIPQTVSFILYNDSSKIQQVKLGFKSIPGLIVKFANGQNHTLQPNRQQYIALQLIAKEKLNKQNIIISGTTQHGKLLPLTMNIKTEPEIAVRGYSRGITVKNNSASVLSPKITFQMRGHLFKPGSYSLDHLQPGKMATEALGIFATNNKKASTYNKWLDYRINSSWNRQKDETMGHYFAFSPEQNIKVVYDNLPYKINSQNPGTEPFKVTFLPLIEKHHLRIVAKVIDHSPNQKCSKGDLKNGGDCMIIAFDTGIQQLTPNFGKDDFECGFAFNSTGPTSYLWDGTYGLEKASEFKVAIKAIKRNKNSIIYDVKIPLDMIYKNGRKNPGMSIAFVNLKANGKKEVIELGSGIFPKRDVRKLGVLLTKKF